MISALDADGPANPRPGQFYMLAAGERWGGGEDERPYLPRAFSHARARRLEDGLELSFLLETVGPGTARLAELRPGDGLLLVGPLGVGWHEPAPGTRLLLAGGGIGAAPLLCLQDERPDACVLLGFRSAAHAEVAGLFGDRVSVATDDGSAGRAGLVTDLLSEAVRADAAVTVYACGPPPMLEAARVICADCGIDAQLALESGMACGFGACFGCVVPTVDGYVRVCLDGPVLDAKLLTPESLAGVRH